MILGLGILSSIVVALVTIIFFARRKSPKQGSATINDNQDEESTRLTEADEQVNLEVDELQEPKEETIANSGILEKYNAKN